MSKQDYFSQHGIRYIDYKDAEVLKKFINSHARINSKRKTNINSKNHRKLEEAIKRARFMGLLPYVSR
ncbi:MAG TPA: 30S ribosomal protein S18 [Candidatus Paceibacterota bacterium]|jgi:small subunit ribosomal protein S18|nr:30S ribosomal protein S18 [Parcubacteria group bacterium]MDP6119587.1 30S ribosomal protein S18 [Candidatus Paceibacterota bacterium]HJN62832.1 30S ribosomal protein S18 [Candidatus Paceibacterota bacterium]|tara:strand:- start:2833 stop:3036 length:204 start_codon:yes stop_codon:yes gene_type:complete